MFRQTATVVTLAVLALPACQSRYNPRVVEIDADGSGSDVDVSYGGGGYIDEIDIGSRDIEFMWEGGLIVGYDDDRVTGTVEYEGGNLSRVIREDDDGDDTTIDFTYDGGRLTKIESDIEAGAFNFETSVRFDYDDNGRVGKITYETETGFGDIETEHTFSYDDSGRLAEVQIEDDNGNDQGEYDFRYGDDGSLEEIDVGAQEFEISYDDSGRIIEVDYASQDYDITYDDGGLAPLNLEPFFLPKSGYIDWAGKTFTAPAADSLLLTLGETSASAF